MFQCRISFLQQYFIASLSRWWLNSPFFLLFFFLCLILLGIIMTHLFSGVGHEDVGTGCGRVGENSSLPQHHCCDDHRWSAHHSHRKPRRTDLSLGSFSRLTGLCPLCYSLPDRQSGVLSFIFGNRIIQTCTYLDKFLKVVWYLL